MSFQHNFAQQNAFQVQIPDSGASAPVGAQAIASAPSRVAQVAVFVAANLLLTTLAPIPEVRAATVQQQKITKWQPADTSRGTPPVLQVVAAAPIVPGITAGLIQTAYQPPDTSRGTPKPLYSDAQLPTSSLAFIAAPIKPWQPRDTSAGMPKPLQPDATTPFATSTPSAPTVGRIGSDTSQSTPRGLQDGLPPGQQETVSAPSAAQVLANTSQGTSNELLPPVAAELPIGKSAWLPAPSTRDARTVLIYRPDVDATVTATPLPPGTSLLLGAPSKLQVLPDGSRSAYALQFPPAVVDLPPGEQQTVSAPVIRSQPTNTSLGTPVGYFPVAAVLPPGEQQILPTPPAKWQPRDTTAGTPKTLIPDDTISVQQEPTAQMSPIQRLWQPRDSSQSSYPLTFPVVSAALPPGQASWVATPPGQWQPGDTSRSAWVAQLPIVLPPTVSPVWFPPLASNWQAPDTSRGTPKPLIPDAQAPVGEQQTATQVGPPAAVTDTSQSAWAITHPAVVVALPPGTSLLLPVPLAIPNVVNTSFGSPDTLTLPSDAPVVTTPPPSGGGYGRRKHRIFVKIDGELFEVRSDQEAVDLLHQAQVQSEIAAKAQADVAAVKADKAKQANLTQPRIPKVELVWPDGIRVPTGFVKTVQAQVEAAQQQITDIYRQAFIAAQQQRERERDERDVQDALAAVNAIDSEHYSHLLAHLMEAYGQLVQGTGKRSRGRTDS